MCIRDSPSPTPHAAEFRRSAEDVRRAQACMFARPTGGAGMSATDMGTLRRKRPHFAVPLTTQL
eukprot:154637-Alexandrium_andersonii.AAC.1